jgi:hypothetical protein
MTISLGIGTIFALFHTSGTIPSFRDTLNISVMAGVNYSKTNTVNQSTSFPGSSPCGGKTLAGAGHVNPIFWG